MVKRVESNPAFQGIAVVAVKTVGFEDGKHFFLKIRGLDLRREQYGSRGKATEGKKMRQETSSHLSHRLPEIGDPVETLDRAGVSGLRS
jgi:hypothetical protein